MSGRTPARIERPAVAPNPTPLGRATSAWDSNPLDFGQVIEIAEVATTYDRWSAVRTLSRRGNRTPQLAAVEELGMLRSDWLGGRDSNPDIRVQSAESYR